MRVKILTLIIALVLSLSITPAHASSNWKSARDNHGNRLRWHSCVVNYAVDSNGYSSARRKPLRAAIRDVERTTGIDFRRVSWKKADLKISLLHKSRGKYYGYTTWRYINGKIPSARTRVYRKTFRTSYRLQVNLYRHELGHSLGLAHVSGSDVMNSLITSNRTLTGWHRGLKWLYRSCR